MLRDRALRTLRRKSDRLTSEVERQVAGALSSVRNRTTVKEIAKLVARRDAEGIYDLTANLPRTLTPATTTLKRAFIEGAKGGRLQIFQAGIEAELGTVNNPYMVTAAAKNAARLVTQIGSETRKGIRQIITLGFRDGLTPQEIAGFVKPMIGLNERQVTAVMRLRSTLEDGGVSESRIEDRTERLTEELLDARAEMIARTEIIASSNAGQQAAWDEAVKEGWIEPDSQKVWIIADDDRLCPRCEDLDGQAVDLDDEFENSYGDSVDTPPLHPNCRCAMGLQPRETP